MNRYSLLTCLFTLALVQQAWADTEKTFIDDAVKPRFYFLPPRPQVPPAEAIDPVAVACSTLIESLTAKANPLPIIDWLNISNLPSFFDPTIRTLLKREEYFNTIDSMGKWDVAAEPYGYYSSFKLDGETFKLSTLGITLDGGIALGERWVVGGGVGYSHANLDWGKHASKNIANTLYFGPYAGYLFDQAYVDLTLLGAYNFYNINHIFEDGEGKKSHHGWDIAAKLNGGWDYEWPKYFGKNFFIQPNGDFSYLWVLQDKIEEESEENPKEIYATIKERTYRFLRFRLGATLRKEFHHREKGLLIPSLSFGYLLMKPLSNAKIKYTCSSTDEEKELKEKGYPTSNQAYVGLKVQAINRRGMMLALGFDAFLANVYPVYLGTLRFEWDF